MTNDSRMVEEIALLYEWLDQLLAMHQEEAGDCSACGKCCDFDAYGHRLYVTHAEMLYFSSKMGQRGLRPMRSGQCPYMEQGRCSVHPYRFSGCRIFGCRGDVEFQNQLTEQTLNEIKSLCDEMDIPYEYMDIRQALNRPNHTFHEDCASQNGD